MEPEKPLEEAEDEGEVGMLRWLEQKHLECGGRVCSVRRLNFDLCD